MVPIAREDRDTIYCYTIDYRNNQIFSTPVISAEPGEPAQRTDFGPRRPDPKNRDFAPKGALRRRELLLDSARTGCSGFSLL